MILKTFIIQSIVEYFVILTEEKFLSFIVAVVGVPATASKVTNKLHLDMVGKGGMSALHYAAQLGETKIIGRLLQAGQD